MKRHPYLLSILALISGALAGERGVVFVAAGHQEPLPPRGLGFVVEKEGFVLTAYQNLIDPASGVLLERISARVGGVTYKAGVIGVEPTLNLGILKLESESDLPFVSSARTSEPIPGARLQAVACEPGGTLRFIDGAVTALNTKLCYQHSLASTMFRASLTIPDESIGGPVFHADTGEVAAIFTGFKPPLNPGHLETTRETHLLPINLCFNIYESLKTKRSLKSPWTGFSVRPLKEEEKRYFPTEKTHQGGVAIEDVWDNSPAQTMGVREGDILVQLGYNRILSVADFQKWLYMYGVDHPVKLYFLRDGTNYVVADYVIEERPEWAKPR